MKRVLNDIFCMSNVRGNKVVKCPKQDFSFYFSAKQGQHGIRVKVVFNDSRLRWDKVGTLKLCDDWKYTPGPDDKHISSSQIIRMKSFFRTYLVLFCMVWDLQLEDPIVADYFETDDVSLHDVIKEIDFYHDYEEELDKITSIQELETFCRKYNLVNFHHNQ